MERWQPAQHIVVFSLKSRSSKDQFSEIDLRIHINRKVAVTRPLRRKTKARPSNACTGGKGDRAAELAKRPDSLGCSFTALLRMLKGTIQNGIRKDARRKRSKERFQPHYPYHQLGYRDAGKRERHGRKSFELRAHNAYTSLTR
jgi:hypothetical protein